MDKGTLLLLAALQVLSLAILAQRFLPESGVRCGRICTCIRVLLQPC